MSKYDKMTDEDFDRILAEMINEYPASNLLDIPGVYDAIKEAYNNDVLSQWELEQQVEEEAGVTVTKEERNESNID